MNDGNAIVYCEGAFNTTNGKTAHGLVRYTRRYNVLSLIDSRYAGQDAGKILNNKLKQISIYPNLNDALSAAKKMKQKVTHFVIGLAPDGGRLDNQTRNAIIKALQLGLNVDAGLHDFLTEDVKMMKMAEKKNVLIRDIRKTPPRNELHFFCGKITEVRSLKIAILGTDSAVGKRTTAWKLLESLTNKGIKTELIGTGQTAWMQGAKYSIILDSLINDFVAGEIEHVIWKAWKDEKPDVIIIEGQGSIMHPAYPGGFELLTAGRPELVILQHAPGREEYDGFPGFKIHPLKDQIKVIELISGKPVIAITINNENLNDHELKDIYKQIKTETGLPVCNPLVENLAEISQIILKRLQVE